MKNIGYLGAHGHPLAQYRDDGHWPPPVEDVPVTPEQLADWRRRHPAAQCSDKVAAILAQIERDFAPRPAGDA